MPFPVTIPFAFGARVGNVAASELDADYQTLATACNDLKALIDAIVSGNVAGTGAPDQLAYWIGTNTIAGSGDLRFDVAGARFEVLPPASLRLPSSTLGGLPASGFPGRLQYVTDVQRGWWTDIGAAGWVPNPINIQIYGAQGNGLADDRAAIQAALDDAAAGSRQIFIPAGLYSIGSPGLVVSQKVALMGVGAGGSTFQRRAAGYPLLSIANPYNVYVQGLGFDGNNLTGDTIQIGPTTIPNTPVPGGFARNTGTIAECIFYGTPKSVVGTSAYVFINNTQAAGGDPVLYGVLDCQFDGGAWHIAISQASAPLVVRTCFFYNYGRNALFGSANPFMVLAWDSAIISSDPSLVNIRVEDSNQMHWRDGYCEGATTGVELLGTCGDILIHNSHAVGNIRWNGTFSDVRILNNLDVFSVVTAFTPGTGQFLWEGNSYSTVVPPRTGPTAVPTAFVVTANAAGNWYNTPQGATSLAVTGVGPGGGFVTIFQQDFTVHHAPTGVQVLAEGAGLGSNNSVSGTLRVRCGAVGAEVTQGYQNNLTFFRTTVSKGTSYCLENIAAAFPGGTYRVILEAQEVSGAGSVTFGSGAADFAQRITVTPF